MIEYPIEGMYCSKEECHHEPALAEVFKRVDLNDVESVSAFFLPKKLGVYFLLPH